MRLYFRHQVGSGDVYEVTGPEEHQSRHFELSRGQVRQYNSEWEGLKPGDQPYRRCERLQGHQAFRNHVKESTADQCSRG